VHERPSPLAETSGVSAGLWKDRPILVTGVTGFVGSSLAARLVGLGARVVGVAKEDSLAGSNLLLLGLDRQVTAAFGRLEDLSFLERTIRHHAVEIIYHLGAQAIVGRANQSPLATFQTNIEGTWNLLEACRGQDQIRAIVVASSDKAYGTHQALPYREEYPLLPQYPYDVSKACADLIARSYFLTYGLPIVITRFSNIYGPGDLNFSRIVPDVIRSVLGGKAPVLRSDGTPERDYLYVDDVVDLYLLLAERIAQTRGEVFNAGHNRPVSALQLAETILRLAGRPDLRPQIAGKGNPHGEIDRQWLDGSKAQRLLGWRPQVPLEEGLRRTLRWYANHLGSMESVPP